MLKRFSILFFLMLLLQTSKTQSLFDSICINKLNSPLPNDKVSFVFNYCELNLLESPENVFDALISTKQFLDENKKISRWGDYFFHVANYFFQTENYDSAMVYYQKTLNNLKPNSLEIRVVSLVHISKIEAKRGNVTMAKVYMNQLISTLSASSDPKLLGLEYQLQAYLSVVEENYPVASNYYQNAISKFRLSGDTIEVGKVYGEISLMYSNIGNFPLALDYLEKAGKIFKKADCSPLIAENYMQKGKTYMTSAKCNEALLNYKLAQELFEILNDKRKLCEVYTEKGKAFEKLLLFDRGLADLNYALEIAKQLNNEDYKIKVLVNLGDIYSKMGKITKGQEYYQKSLALIENVDLKLELYEKLSINYSILLDYKKAYKYQVLYNSLNQNILNKKAEEKLLQNENKLSTELASTENQKQLLQKELSILVDSKKQRVFLYVILLVLQTIVLLIVILLFLRNKKQNEKIISKLKNTVRDQRNTLGKNKLDYDKLKKTSERIFSITTKNMWEPYWVLERLSNQLINDPELDKLNATNQKFDNDQLIMARNLLENVLHWAKQQQGLLEIHPKSHNVNDLLTPIIKIQKLRAAAKNIEIIYNPQFNKEVYTDRITTEVAIRNIIENAIKFSTLNGKITIDVESNNSFVEIIIVDNGVGMTKDQINALFSVRKPYMAAGTHGEKGVGLGLSLTKMFIERNSGTLKIESSIAMGTTVSIILPSSSKA